MTTICYRARVLASDSGIWIGGTLLCRMKKLYKLKNGSIAGLCGTVQDALKLIAWLDDEDRGKERIGGDVEILLITKRGCIRTYSSSNSAPLKTIKTEYIAIGTGAAVALGAMHHGASASEAVKAAIDHDSMTSGPIQTLKLDE